MFVEMNERYTSKEMSGNEDYVDIKGKCIVDVNIEICTKLIYDILFVREINQKLPSVGQMLEKQYSLFFQDDALY